MPGGFIGGEPPHRDGEREMDLRLTAKLPYRDGAGCCYHFEDLAGRCIVWFSKRRHNLEVGSTLRASFVIYKHTECNGRQQNLARKFQVLFRVP